MKNLKAKTISVLLTFMAFSNSLIISNAIENKLDTINDEEQNLELIQGTTNEDSEQITNDTNNIEDTSTFSAISSKELEPNDNISQANTISVGKKYSGVTDKYGYPDYYKFTLSQDGYIDINFKENQNVRFDFKLEDNSQKSHGTWSTNYGSGTKTVRMGLAKGTY